MNDRQAIAYSRVSTGRQAEHGSSLEVQRQTIETYCKGRGFLLPDELYTDEGISGRSTRNRPGLEAALTECCQVGGVLIVTSLSRLARSTSDACSILARLHAHKSDLVILDISADTTTAAGKLVFAIMAAVAEFESDLKSESIRASRAYLRAKRGFRAHGTRTAGYDVVNGELVEVAAERNTLDIAKSVKIGKSYSQAAEELNARGVPTIRQLRNNGSGAPWSKQTLHALLHQPPARDDQ